MSVHDSIVRLEQSLTQLGASLDDVVLIAGDLPECDDEPALVDALRDRATGVRGEVHAAFAAAHRFAIADAHRACNAAARRIRTELMVRANFEEIAAIAVTRGGAWNRWSEVVRQALDEVAAASETTGAALLDCWRELAAQYRIPV